MSHLNVKATLQAISTGDVTWVPVGGDMYQAHYPSAGMALFVGPVQGNNWECQCENQATVDEVTSRAISVGPLKSEVRANPALRNAAANRNKHAIRNSRGEDVGYLPDLVICGTDPRASFMGDEDIETAETVTGLSGLP